MGKILLFLILFVFNSTVNSQNIIDLISNNDYKGVEKYKKTLDIPVSEYGTPLMYAIFKSDLKMVKLIIEKGANPKYQGLMQVNLKGDIDQSFTYGSCITVAAGENKLDIIKYLLKKGVQVDEKESILLDDEYTVKDNAGWTALQWACVQGNDNIVKYLLKKDADINLAYIHKSAFSRVYDEFYTPLLLSLKYKHFKISKILIKNGADVNKFTDYCLSPLAIAYQSNDKELIKLLLLKGAKMFSRPEMNVKKHILLKDDSIANKYFSKKELEIFELFLTKIDSVILGSYPTTDKISQIYIDSLKSKLFVQKQDGFIRLFNNHDFNLSLIKNINYKIWEVEVNEKYKTQQIKLNKKVADFLIECIIRNNNLSNYVKIARASGDFPFSYSNEFVYINPLLDRDRFFVSVLLFYASFPTYTAKKQIKNKNINSNYYKYTEIIELK